MENSEYNLKPLVVPLYDKEILLGLDWCQVVCAIVATRKIPLTLDQPSKFEVLRTITFPENLDSRNKVTEKMEIEDVQEDKDVFYDLEEVCLELRSNNENNIYQIKKCIKANTEWNDKEKKLLIETIEDEVTFTESVLES